MKLASSSLLKLTARNFTTQTIHFFICQLDTKNPQTKQIINSPLVICCFWWAGENSHTQTLFIPPLTGFQFETTTFPSVKVFRYTQLTSYFVQTKWPNPLPTLPLPVFGREVSRGRWCTETKWFSRDWQKALNWISCLITTSCNCKSVW